MILIEKEYYPDYDEEDPSGTEVIEHVYEIETDKTEAELILAYNAVVDKMVKGHKDYKEKNSPLKISRMKGEVRRVYNFNNYLLTEYKNREVNFIVS